jgi:hypothetical protein
MEKYNITLSEIELLEVVTALEAAPHRVLRRGPAATEMYELSQRITDQAAEQFHNACRQLLLPYGPLSEWSYV